MKLLSVLFIVIIVLTVTGCSTTPPTKYYTLVPVKISAIENPIQKNRDRKMEAIGVGPIVIPDMLDNVNIVSVTNSNEIVLSYFHLWAGDLNNTINQVLADNISSHLNIDSVWPFPWDNRNRPETQIRMVFERFGGTLGETITLQVKWTLLKDYGRKEVMTQKYRITKKLAGTDYLTYVQGLNEALNEFSIELAEKL